MCVSTPFFLLFVIPVLSSFSPSTFPGATIELSGIDLLNGTPILDIKPYIPTYDSPQSNEITQESTEEITTAPSASSDTAESSDVLPERNQSDSSKIAEWVTSPPINKLTVRFTSTSEEQLTELCKYRDATSLLNDREVVRQGITAVLQADPRSVYRRKKCYDRLYYNKFDRFHFTSWFDDAENVVEVLKIKPRPE